MEDSVGAVVGGVGCTTARVALRRLPGSRSVRVSPRPGAVLDASTGGGDAAEAVVQDVDVRRRRIAWTVGPTASVCASNDAAHGPGGWTWATGRESWTALHRRRYYVVDATRRRGIRSIAGLRVRPRGRRNPLDVAAVRRAFGRPRSLRPLRFSEACRGHWPRLGLRVVFVNFGGRDPCRKGFFQTASIRGRAARRWAVAVGRRPTVVAGHALGWLRGVYGRGERAGRTWTLSEIFLPFGVPDYYPAVGAVFRKRQHLGPGSRVRGFDLYVGAGGD